VCTRPDPADRLGVGVSGAEIITYLKRFGNMVDDAAARAAVLRRER
jgi:hypothetical protein